MIHGEPGSLSKPVQSGLSQRSWRFTDYVLPYIRRTQAVIEQATNLWKGGGNMGKVFEIVVAVATVIVMIAEVVNEITVNDN